MVPLTSGLEASPKPTVTEPSEPVLTEIWARLERSSSALSRWSISVLGVMPACWAWLIWALSVAIVWASWATWPLAPVRDAYCWEAWLCTVCICCATALKVEARVWPAPTTPCSVDAFWVEPSAFQADQKFAITLCSPLDEGSLTAVWTCPSSVALELALLVALFCARYCTSRNWLRMRLMSVIETPVPIWLPPPWPGIVSGAVADVCTLWRV